jgi:hypothetical protein
MMIASPALSNLIRIRTYAALGPWVAGFAAGKFNLLFVTGPPGLGKSRMVQAALAGQPHLYIEGHVTPLKMHIDLFHHRDQPVVIDDEDTFHTHPQKVSQMKCLCGTEPVKRVRWETTCRVLAECEVPEAFETTSKVVVITNHARAVSPPVAALFDRGTLLSFEPPAREIHARVEGWLDDPEILAFFARWLRVIPLPSMRLYAKAKEMKAAGIDWRATLMGQWKAGRLWVVDQVQADPALTTEAERAAAFEARGGGARATYYRYLKKWRRAIGPDAG